MHRLQQVRQAAEGNSQDRGVRQVPIEGGHGGLGGWTIRSTRDRRGGWMGHEILTGRTIAIAIA